MDSTYFDHFVRGLFPRNCVSRQLAMDGNEPLLIRARGHDAGPGSVSEIHLKHLLALNLRKLGGAEHAFAPRSYILLPGDFFREEFNSFVLDFKISQALALVKHVAHVACGDVEVTGAGITGYTPEGLWGRELPTIRWEPGPGAHQPLSNEMVDVALSIIECRLFEDDSSVSSDCKPLSELEWIQIRSFDTQSSLESISTAQVERCRNTWSRVKDLMPERQASLLHRNFWALKPSCGQFGRGILLIDRLPEEPGQLLEWAAAVGRGGLKGGNDVREGVVLQKLIEQPHLLDKQLLGNLGNPGNPAGDSVSGGKFKYNLRMIVLATLRSPCRIWLYNEGFVSLALCPFTSQLDPLSHITNLRQGAGYESQRRWPIRDLDSYLAAKGRPSFDDSFRPQIERIISSLFYALSLHPTSLLPLDPCDETGDMGRSAAGKKLRRFGFDFLIDQTETVWLLEVNFLKNGYAIGHAQSGPAGDAKRDFVQDFMVEETALRKAVAGQTLPVLPSSFVELQPKLCHPTPTCCKNGQTKQSEALTLQVIQVSKLVTLKSSDSCHQ